MTAKRVQTYTPNMTPLIVVAPGRQALLMMLDPAVVASYRTLRVAVKLAVSTSGTIMTSLPTLHGTPNARSYPATMVRRDAVEWARRLGGLPVVDLTEPA